MERSEEEIVIDYITVKLMEDNKFISHPHIRVRSAWIEPKNIFKNVSSKQRQNTATVKEISKGKFGTDGGT